MLVLFWSTILTLFISSVAYSETGDTYLWMCIAGEQCIESDLQLSLGNPEVACYSRSTGKGKKGCRGVYPTRCEVVMPLERWYVEAPAEICLALQGVSKK